MTNDFTIYADEAIGLLRKLIATPSLSREEDATAAILCEFLTGKGIEWTREGNNIIAYNKHYDKSKPTLLLNSHHDTVKPNPKYTRDPYAADIVDGKLYGLGSNDAGGCLVSLLLTFTHYYALENAAINVIFVASAEEEISGVGGIEKALTVLPAIDYAIVGEPTLMQMAIAERGLLVLDCMAEGKPGHAARNEGDNAITKAIKDIDWINNHQFEKISPLLGASRMSVTVIETENKAHNVVPAICKFVIDARLNELYSFEELIETLREHLISNVQPRSTRLRSTSIAMDHPLVKAGLMLNREYYGSPTTSDKALMPFPSLKMGPGDSARSHSADEFIFTNEIMEGISLYIQLINQLV